MSSATQQTPSFALSSTDSGYAVAAIPADTQTETLAANTLTAIPAIHPAPATVAPTWTNIPLHEGITFDSTCTHAFNRLAIGMMRQTCHEARTPTAIGTKERRMSFLFGGCSLGKTHLLHAAANEMMTLYGYRFEDLAFFSATTFTQQVSAALSANHLDAWIAAVSGAKVFLLDDVHALAGNDIAQNVLVAISDCFENELKPRFFTSLITPDSLTQFNQRLIKRFQWGMLVELEKIDRTQRAAIISQRAHALSVFLPEAIIHHLGGLELDTIREIDALLSKLVSVSTIMNQEITLEFVRRLTQPIHPEIRRTITMVDIETFIRERFNISHDDMLSPKRSRNIAFPRQIAMYLTHEYTHTSMEAIGDYYGGRDHSTVKHACEKIRDCQHADPVVKSVLERFQQTFC